MGYNTVYYTHTVTRSEEGTRTLIIPMITYDAYVLCRKGDIYTLRRHRSRITNFGFSAGARYSRASGIVPLAPITGPSIRLNTRIRISTSSYVTYHESYTPNESVPVPISLDQQTAPITIGRPTAPGRAPSTWEAILTEQISELTRQGVVRDSLISEMAAKIR